jgi:putative ABC transport system ATP-binding protein
VIARDLVKTYGARIHALAGVSFTLARGELALLTGPSGSGKTTVLNLIAGLDEADSGDVRVDGTSVGALPDTARYRREVVGFVFQLHHLIAGLTAKENVEVPLIPSVASRAERSRRALAALAEVGLEERNDHLPQQLSGGERQRVAIARAVVGRPRLLLADEPTGALDTHASAEVLALLASLGKSHAMTVLLVSHDPDAERYAGHVLELRDGRIVADRAPPAAPTRELRPAANG